MEIQLEKPAATRTLLLSSYIGAYTSKIEVEHLLKSCDRVASRHTSMEKSMKKPVGVTRGIIEDFLSKAEEQGVAKETISSLRQTLIEEGKSTEKALLQAIFPETTA